MKFQDLGLDESILRGVAAAGYESPTEIQAKAIPIVLDGRDLVGLGQTGSGKTAAFGLPLLSRLVGGEPGLRAVILVPTRELCVQVAENLRAYAQHTGLHVCTAFGGIPMGVQEAAIRRGLDVLVACPGRMIDHLESGNFELSKVEVLVLDEADRMLDMGFMPQIRRILMRMPQERQNLLFSATMPPEVDRLVKDFLSQNLERVQIGQRSQAASTITQRFEEVQADRKIDALTKILRSREGDGRVLIFVNRKTRAEELGKKLKRAGLPADSIHGDKSAESRHVVLQAFSRGKVKHLVATDVAARGIDVSDIGVVVNFDMPLSTEDYIHRVGRTGRAGSDGASISLVARTEKRNLRDVLAHLDRTSKMSRIVVNGKVLREGVKGAGAGDGVLAEDSDDRRRPAKERGSRRRRDDDARDDVRADEVRADEVEASAGDERPARRRGGRSHGRRTDELADRGAGARRQSGRRPSRERAAEEAGDEQAETATTSATGRGGSGRSRRSGRSTTRRSGRDAVTRREVTLTRRDEDEPRDDVSDVVW